MKKWLYILVVLVVAIGAGLFFVKQNLDAIVKTVIEKSGTAATGTPVTVGEVAIDLENRRAAIRNLSVANYPGFGPEAMMEFAELSVELGESLTEIVRVYAEQPRFVIEASGKTSNYGELQKNIDKTIATRGGEDASGDSTADSAAEENPVNLTIRQVEIVEPSVKLLLRDLDKQQEVDIQRIELNDLQGTPGVIALQVVKQLTRQVIESAGRTALDRELQEQLESAAGQELKSKAKELENDLKNLLKKQGG